MPSEDCTVTAPAAPAEAGSESASESSAPKKAGEKRKRAGGDGRGKGKGKKRGPPRPHGKLSEEVLQSRVEKLQERIAKSKEQIEDAERHLEVYLLEIKYRKLDAAHDEPADEKPAAGDRVAPTAAGAEKPAAENS